jgi:hypothetical protein
LIVKFKNNGIVIKILNFVKKLKEFFDSDLIFTAFNQISAFIAGPLLLLVIPYFINEIQQGYWYTITSFNGLTNLADLGFIFLILQFSAHEFAFLFFDKNKNLFGDQDHLVKLSALFHFMLKWIIIMSISVFPLIFIYGFFILSSQSSIISWFFPYLLYIISLIFDFALNNLLSFTEGCNSVSEMQKIRFFGTLIQSIGIFLFLLLGFGLYAIAIPIIIKAIFCLFSVLKKFGLFYKKLLHIPYNSVFSWKKEILPLLSRYAISYISGYLGMFIYTPIMFVRYGAIESGKLGLTLSIMWGILTISNVWINSVIPKLNMYVARKNWKELDHTVKLRLFLSLLTFFISSIILLAFYFLFLNKLLILQRIVNIQSLLVLLIIYFNQVLINGIAIYLRAHKQEPLAITSLFIGIYCLISTLLLSTYASINYFMYGALSASLVQIPIFLIILKKKCILWHNQEKKK